MNESRSPVTSAQRDRIAAMSEGNPGAIGALVNIVTVAFQYDGTEYVDHVLDYLETMKITGPLIWLCFKDICQHNPIKVVAKIEMGTMASELQKLSYSHYKKPKK